jgi:PiT family inorganic phosphate transporter
MTCTGVSFAHGSNDGQKGIGLIMLILIGLVPANYALNMSQSREEFQQVAQATKDIHELISDPKIEKKLAAQRPARSFVDSLPSLESVAHAKEDAIVGPPPEDTLNNPNLSTVQELLESLHNDLKDKSSLSDFSSQDRWQVRTKTVMIEHALTHLNKQIITELSEEKAAILNQSRSRLRGTIEYAPTWVLFAVAVALGFGTMIGWKRIVVTVGEKIGKSHLTYSQGASAELVAMTTIGMADILGMPVSTTHVLSSGVAGTMAANKTGLQMSTIKSILMAWILTLPVSMVLAAGIFLVFRMFV